MDPATHVVTKYIISVVSTLYYTYILLTKTCKILHYWYHNVCMLIVNYFIVECFKEMLVYARRKCRRYVKDCIYKLQNSALVGVT
jgi:hypothetical protein